MEPEALDALLSWSFPVLALATLVLLPLYAWRERGRNYAVFAAIVLGIALPGALVAHPRLVALFPPDAKPWLDVLFAYSMLAAAAHLAHLVRARMRAWPFRWGVSIPGQVFIAAGAMEGLWLLALLPIRGLLGFLGWEGVTSALRWLDLLPFAVAVLSILTSTRPTVEWVRVRLGKEGPDEVARIPVERHRRRAPTPLTSRPLRIVQITDPHLGPWQSIPGLRRTVARLLDREPDLVLLTGDFLTMESSGTPGALAQAFTPLRALDGRCFAIFGNHDHEAPMEVMGGLAANGVRLLVDQEALVETDAGPVQIIGADWVRRERKQHLAGLLARFPRREGPPAPPAAARPAGLPARGAG